MAARHSTTVRTHLAWLACVLIACVPTGLLRLTVCDCNGVLVETRVAVGADVCPCARDVASEPGGCEAAASCCGDQGDDCEDPDACCTDLSMPDLLPASGGVDVPTPDDHGAELPFDVAGDSLSMAAVALRELAEATGPPGRHRTRRALEARAAVVLLI